MRAVAVAAACALGFAFIACGTDEETERRVAEAEKQVNELTEEIEELREKLTEGQDCEEQVAEVRTALSDLKAELAVGMSYDEYANAVSDASVAHGRVEVSRMDIECVSDVGVPLEKALNKYIKAANEWGDCIDELSCDLDAIDPKLQRLWHDAGDLLADADDGISQLVSEVEDRIEEAEEELEEAKGVLAEHSES